MLSSLNDDKMTIKLGRIKINLWDKIWPIYFHEIHMKKKSIKVAYKGMIVTFICEICTINILYEVLRIIQSAITLREATKDHRDQKRTAFTPEECENLA